MSSAASTGPATRPHTVDRAEILAGLPQLVATIAAGAAERDRDRELPFAAFDAVRRSGITILRVPSGLGGPGGSIADLIEAITAVASADSNVAHALRTHFNQGEAALANPASPEARDYAEKALAGVLFGGAHTELETPRPAEVSARLSRDGDGYRLNGRKFYSTGTLYADIFSTSALDEDGNPARVVLPVGRDGVTILDDWDGMGQRLTASGSILYENVAVHEQEVRRAGAGGPSPAARHASTFRQLFLAACIAGIVRNVLADAVQHAREKARPTTHSPAGSARTDLFIQAEIGEIAAASQVADQLTAHAARTLDGSFAAIQREDAELHRILEHAAVTVAAGQVALGPIALSAAERIFNVGGASATSRRYNFDRHWRNIRTILSHNPLAYKAQVVGDQLLNGTDVPQAGGFF
ncbi:acyl-CoA dehydrogenase [Kaistia sp. 32K]|uniref:acyl-CoA dehydrogenase family protein n=1 Tax=Kaistia sp. 32K TaxID=2795690 RepID=UPI00191567FC|nr:acyl-CoA dehydrogenase family protein [Kaistia sp. 32K]BCP55539.1 acyl-CoA dehydrogenase [Kaistia sp. 32K]